MTGLRAPFPWYGSKRGAAILIEQLHGDVNNLVIPCAGSIGELLGRSSPAKIELVNDLDGLVVNAWRAIKYSPERVADLVDYPVHEVTLHAVHDHLIHARTTKGLRRRSMKSGRRGSRPLAEYLREDERHHDTRLAAWWIWGRSCWLGGGWCKETSRKRPALAGQGDRPHKGHGVARQIGREGQGDAMRTRVQGRGGSVYYGQGVAKPVTWRARPHLSHAGNGITPRQMPMVSGSYTGHPGHGNGVHSSDAHRQGLLDWMEALAERLRFTRIICGDWRRALTPATTTSHGLTGVSFDPTYDLQATGRSSRLYRKDDPGMSSDARAWCIEHGEDPLLRIVLCGKGEEHDKLLGHGWTKHVWRERDGETLWASPHCVAPRGEQQELFG